VAQAVQVSTLPNGVRVVSEKLSQSETVAIGAWVAAGGRCETKENNGVSHFLEHMAFKGTTTRTAKQIAEEIERVGGYLNAYTAREETAYHVHLLKEDLAVGVEILSDILINPTFCAEELERERGVILQEIGRYQDSPDCIVFDHFQQTAYPDQPMGRSILGPQEVVSSLSVQDLRAYRDHLYRGPHFVVSAAGHVDHGTFVQLASQCFSGLPAAPSEHVLIPSHYQGGVFADARPLEQVHLTIGVESIAFGDPDYYVAALFNIILGSGMSSRLFQEVREKRGLVYSVHSSRDSYKDSGTLVIYAGTGEDKCEELVQILRDECHKMVEGVTKEEMQRARAQSKASLLMGAESAPAVCSRNAEHLLIYDRLIPREEIVARIEAVTDREVAHFTERLFSSDQAATLAVVGPVKEERAQKLARLFQS
jgi:predicted Zn-dependent peptidase